VKADDLFLRYDGGPVQCFRVWDRARFIESQANQCADHKDAAGKPAPMILKLATVDEYRAEQRKARR
jgi:hypothetical protein